MKDSPRVMVDVGDWDFKLLRHQKSTLLKMISELESQERGEDAGAFQGLLHGLDDLMDQAAEKIGAEAVFGPGNS